MGAERTAAYGADSATFRRRLRQALRCIGALLAFMYALQVLNALVGQRLCLLGVQPRTLVGLIGVLVHPVLHASFGHLLVNTVPFAVLGGLVAMRGRDEFLELSLFVALVEGVALWLFGRSGAIYVGVSGLIFGYFG